MFDETFPKDAKGGFPGQWFACRTGWFFEFFVETAACGFQKVENISTHYRIIENIE